MKKESEIKRNDWNMSIDSMGVWCEFLRLGVPHRAEISGSMFTKIEHQTELIISNSIRKALKEAKPIGKKVLP